MNPSPTDDGSNFFETLGVTKQLATVLAKMGIVKPTPIQHQSLPVTMKGKDIMGIAQTGTGKTLAFGLPLVQRLQTAPGRALILLPTRELALQVDETLRLLGKACAQRTAVLIGGESMYRQIMDLKASPRIIIATPGRLLDHMEQRQVSLDDIKILVLDEADRMLDMGFAPQLNRILKNVPRERQTMLFSATMPQTIVKLATTYMAQPVRVEVAPAGTTAEIEQEIFIVRQEVKLLLLEKLLEERTGTALVFSRTKHGAKKITRVLNAMGHSAAEIHANRTQAQRKAALEGFKSGKFRILVATDIAARGIDVNDIAVVINFDLPSNSEDYVHRIGRTGRAGKTGHAVSFATPQQQGEIRTIERLIRKSITISKLPELPVRAGTATESISDDRPMRRSRPRPQGRSSGPANRGGNPGSRFGQRRG